MNRGGYCVGQVKIGHGDCSGDRHAGITFREGRSSTVPATHGDRGVVIGPGDGDHHITVHRSGWGIGVSGTDGVGENQLLAGGEVVKGVGPGIESPGHGLAGLGVG